MPRKKKKQPTKKIYYIIYLITLLISIYLIYTIYKLNLIPNKYLIIFTSIIAILNIIALIIYKKNRLKFIAILLDIILLSISFIGIKYGTETINFLNNAFNNNKIERTTYDIVVLKKSKYQELKTIANIGYLNEEKEELNQKIKELNKVNTNYDDIYTMYEALLNNKIHAIILNDSYIDVLKEDYEDIEDKIEIIDTFIIETKIEEQEVIKKLKPINIYLSGSDSRSSEIVDKSRSDVNMIITINPETHKILITTIPRDYYVMVHGQTGLKDKLTHAGIYGLDTSRKTVEDLFDIKIDYSIKIGFNSVVELVDLVGGVDIDSDTEFDSYHMKGWHVKKGINHMDGKKALAYARERYAYRTGDRHRIQNQEQVLEAVLKKLSKSKTLLTKYEKILDSISKFYKTTIPKEYITLLIKDQLTNMEEWEIENMTVSGSDLVTNTHTSPKLKRYVMVPYEKDVKKVTERINEILDEER